MRTIPATAVETSWERLCGISPEEIKELVDEMARRQPAILGYLMASDEDLMEEKERGHLLMLGSFIWSTMSEHQPDLGQITPERLDEAEDANMKMIEGLADESEYGFANALEQLNDTYNQMPLLSVVLVELMSDYEEEPELANENIGLALLYLKSVIDCLDGGVPLENLG